MLVDPLLSVIVPVYNAENTLKKCLDSIKKQIYTKYEVILIDDGSKDKSGQICDYYSSKDSRFIVIHTINQGVSKARNIGLEQANGKYVMFVDCDDYIYPDYFDTYVNFIEKSQSDVVIGGLVCENRGCTTIKNVFQTGKKSSEIWEDICLRPEMFGYIAGKIMCTNIIKKNNIRFNTMMYSQEDLDFNLSVYEKCTQFVIIDYAGYEYEYIPGKRKPPVWDFIGNTLKMYRIGMKKIILSNEAKYAIKDRVIKQIFSFLYNCSDKEEYLFAVQKMNNVEGLYEYLELQKVTGEAKYIIKWYLAKKYERIYKYFSLRKMIKRMMGLPVSE